MLRRPTPVKLTPPKPGPTVADQLRLKIPVLPDDPVGEPKVIDLDPEYDWIIAGKPRSGDVSKVTFMKMDRKK